jgi:minor histocompatibility antigen H13
MDDFLVGGLHITNSPYMVTVATKLDVPIKLSFESGARSSILGLGDIVIPGIVICLALRFDLWRHYNKKITSIETTLKTETSDGFGGSIVPAAETGSMRKKARYVDVTGVWGDWFWTSSWFSIFSKVQMPEALKATQFPKTYFIASMVGYFLGMLVTLTMLLIFKRGQPALLYLVPGVLGALWMTGLVRGEIHDMWIYTEDGSLDTEDIIVELDGDGQIIKKEAKNSDKDSAASALVKKPEEDGKKALLHDKESEPSSAPKPYDVVLFSITAPLPETEGDLYEDKKEHAE